VAGHFILAVGHHEDRSPTHGYAGDARSRYGGFHQELAAGNSRDQINRRRRSRILFCCRILRGHLCSRREQLTAGTHTPERCIQAAFQFLLDREPKESILRRFDVSVISRYFPEFERELPRYLSRP
jgi:hypothetical protein